MKVHTKVLKYSFVWLGYKGKVKPCPFEDYYKPYGLSWRPYVGSYIQCHSENPQSESSSTLVYGTKCDHPFYVPLSSSARASV